MSFRVEIEGLDQLLSGYDRFTPAMKKRVKARFNTVTAAAVGIARPLTPTEPDGGFLKASVRSTPARDLANDAGVSAAVVAGGDPLKGSAALAHHKNNVYAIVQHEDTTLKHDDGESHFLEKGVIQASGDLVEQLEGDVDPAAKEAGLAG